MSIVPPGYANAETPFYAGTLCGNVDQDTDYTTSGATPEPIGFQTSSSWSDTQSLTSEDGFTWTCNTSGIYNLRCNQTLSVTNTFTAPDINIPVIANTVFYMDVSGTLVAPQTGTALLHGNSATGSSISFTTEGVGEDVEMATFTTLPGFLTSTVIPGGNWNLSLWANTTDDTELNSAFISVYYVDDDGVSNPEVIYDGATETFLVSGSAIYNYNHNFTVGTYTIPDLTKRIQFRLYANFGVASTMTFYFRNQTLSSVGTTISQDVVPPTVDVVNVRITVVSGTSELNQVFATSVPVTMTAVPTLTYNTSVNALANLYAGDTVEVSIATAEGNVEVTSASVIGGATNKFQWNLLATGTFGHQTPVEAPMLMSAPAPEVVVVPPIELEPGVPSGGSVMDL